MSRGASSTGCSTRSRPRPGSTTTATRRSATGSSASVGVGHHAGRPQRARARPRSRARSGQPRQPAARHRLAPDVIPRSPTRRSRRRSCIVGLPRTGTTALSHLLACDPDNRSLLGWEAGAVGPAAHEPPPTDDPRLRRRHATPSGMLGPAQPGVQGDPPRPARQAPSECAVLLAQHFQSADLLDEFNVPDYDEWMLAADGRAPRTRTTGRCCRCSSRSAPGGGS